ncbi:MAG: hypothetical protein SGI90_02330 [Candidatus Eisenbacteria bacterium]|nr:hypothetical protein [Candidatus Eisenbacteria bacterium]
MKSTRSVPRRSLVSRLADLGVLILGIASVLAVLEMAVRPFYPASPGLVAPQVRHRASAAHGWEMVPDLSANSFAASAPIDLRGYRLMNPPPGVGDPDGGLTPDRPRWLAAGGGNMFGVGVVAESIFAVRASRHALGTGAVLLNSATDGFDIGQKVRRIEADAVLASPDLILLEIELSDLPAGGLRDTTLSLENQERAALRLNRRPPREGDTWARILGRSRLASLIDGRARAFVRLGQRLPTAEPVAGNFQVRAIDILLGRETPAIEASWQAMGAQMDRVADTADRVRARVCVVALPLPAQLRRPYPRASFQSRMERICFERGFVFVDPLPALREERRAGIRLYLPRLPYLSEAGHRVVAEQIRRELETPLAHEENGRLPSRIDE